MCWVSSWIPPLLAFLLFHLCLVLRRKILKEHAAWIIYLILTFLPPTFLPEKVEKLQTPVLQLYSLPVGASCSHLCPPPPFPDFASPAHTFSCLDNYKVLTFSKRPCNLQCFLIIHHTHCKQRYLSKIVNWVMLNSTSCFGDSVTHIIHPTSLPPYSSLTFLPFYSNTACGFKSFCWGTWFFSLLQIPFSSLSSWHTPSHSLGHGFSVAYSWKHLSPPKLNWSLHRRLLDKPWHVPLSVSNVWCLDVSCLTKYLATNADIPLLCNSSMIPVCGSK